MTTVSPSISDLFRVFGRIGLLSFGGPAAQIALMHKELVDTRGWIKDRDFLGALSFCMLLPGPEAMQLATYTGWKLRGTLGGLIAGLLFILPGALVILALSFLYIWLAEVPLVQAGFVGIKAAVIAIVVQALWKVSQKALTGRAAWIIAGLAFLAIYRANVSFVFILLVAGLLGVVVFRETASGDQKPPAPSGHGLWHIPLWIGLWSAPLLLVYVIDQTFLLDIGLFFSKLAVVTFGGAYAVLAYMTQTVSVELGWITTTEMIDALGLAETTPGPLILVTEFVGLLAGFKQGGVPLMLAAGALTLWCTFVPCFLWIFAAAPYLDRVLAQPTLKATLTGISAAVVGVILNLSLVFALHVLFGAVSQSGLGLRPDIQSFDPVAFGLMCLAGILLLGLRWPLGWVLLITTAIACGAALL
ncbi:chromate efflux transporter [Cognatishimia sp.]|uniref:chromate efflux transporter n=1 Tax=Cognatishimia sp. TaxID=2211648 RepID=UPI003514113E